MRSPIRIGVSACLLGERTRYDGGHKLDRLTTGTLRRYFRFVPVCPEVGCGLSVPREPMRLEGEPARPRLVTIATRNDLTERMRSFCGKELRRAAGLSGFILKRNSPSCGLFRVPVWNEGSAASGRGLFAAALLGRFPLLPVEEEGRLRDPALRLNFIKRVFGYGHRPVSRSPALPAPKKPRLRSPASP